MQIVTFKAVDQYNRALAGASVSVFLTGTNTYASLYNTSLATISNPITADSNGNVQFLTPNGTYDLSWASGAYVSPLIQGDQIYDLAGFASAIATLQAAQGAGLVAFTTLALLNADLNYPANTPAIVTSDPTPANDGTYIKSGASGSGSWSQVSSYSIASLGTQVAANTASIATLNTEVAANTSAITSLGSGADQDAITSGELVSQLDPYGVPLNGGTLITVGTKILGISVASGSSGAGAYIVLAYLFTAAQIAEIIAAGGTIQLTVVFTTTSGFLTRNPISSGAGYAVQVHGASGVVNTGTVLSTVQNGTSLRRDVTYAVQTGDTFIGMLVDLAGGTGAQTDTITAVSFTWRLYPPAATAATANDFMLGQATNANVAILQGQTQALGVATASRAVQRARSVLGDPRVVQTSSWFDYTAGYTQYAVVAIPTRNFVADSLTVWMPDIPYSISVDSMTQLGVAIYQRPVARVDSDGAPGSGPYDVIFQPTLLFPVASVVPDVGFVNGQAVTFPMLANNLEFTPAYAYFFVVSGLTSSNALCAIGIATGVSVSGAPAHVTGWYYGSGVWNPVGAPTTLAFDLREAIGAEQADADRPVLERATFIAALISNWAAQSPPTVNLPEIVVEALRHAPQIPAFNAFEFASIGTVTHTDSGVTLQTAGPQCCTYQFIEVNSETVTNASGGTVDGVANGGTFTRGTHYTLDYNSGLISTTVITACLVNIAYTAYPSRYDWLLADPHSGALSSQTGTARGADVNEYIPTPTSGYLPLCLALVNDSPAAGLGGVWLQPTSQWRDQVRIGGEAEHMAWLEYCRHRMPNTAKAMRTGGAILVAAIGDSITCIGDAALSYLVSVACATTGNITLSGEQVIDGFTTSGSRVLVKNQSTPSQNGIYNSGAGAWSRSVDATTGAQIFCCTVSVVSGSVNAGTTWSNTNIFSGPEPIVIGTSAINFAQQNAVPNGVNRDNIVFFDTGRLASDTLAAIPLLNFSDGGGAVHVENGADWSLVKAIQARSASTVYYDNWAIGGTTSASTLSSGLPNGSNTGLLAAVNATTPTILTIGYGMNELGSSSTYANIRAICANVQAGSPNTDIIVKTVTGIPQTGHAAAIDVWAWTCAEIERAARDANVAFVPYHRLANPENMGAMGVAQVTLAETDGFHHPGPYELAQYGKALASLIS